MTNKGIVGRFRLLILVVCGLSLLTPIGLTARGESGTPIADPTEIAIPTDIPATDVSPTEAPPTEVPTDVPPTETVPTETSPTGVPTNTATAVPTKIESEFTAAGAGISGFALNPPLTGKQQGDSYIVVFSVTFQGPVNLEPVQLAITDPDVSISFDSIYVSTSGPHETDFSQLAPGVVRVLVTSSANDSVAVNLAIRVTVGPNAPLGSEYLVDATAGSDDQAITASHRLFMVLPGTSEVMLSNIAPSPGDTVTVVISMHGVPPLVGPVVNYSLIPANATYVAGSAGIGCTQQYDECLPNSVFGTAEFVSGEVDTPRDLPVTLILTYRVTINLGVPAGTTMTFTGMSNVDPVEVSATLTVSSIAEPTATPTVTPVPTATSTETPAPTATSTETPAPTATSTETPIPTATATETPAPTATATETPAPTATSTETPIPTATSTETPVPTATSTETPVPTATVTETPVPTATATETPIPTATATETPVPTATETETPVLTATPTETPVPTATATETPMPTTTATEASVPTATSTETPVPTATSTETPAPTATETETPVPTATETSVPTATETETPIPTATATETPVPTATSTETPAPTATETTAPTATATETPVPTATDTSTATEVPPTSTATEIPPTATRTPVEPDLLVAQTLNLNVAVDGSVTGNLADQIIGGTPPYTFVLVTAPTKGLVTISLEGLFTYTANEGESGSDSFSYAVSDSQEEPQAAAVVTGDVTLIIAAQIPTPTPTVEPAETAPAPTTVAGSPVVPDPTPSATAGVNQLPNTGTGENGASNSILALLMIGTVLLATAAWTSRRRHRL